MKLHWLALSLVLCCPALAYAEQYLCVTDYSTGFRYDENSKSWSPTNFKNNKFIISKANEDEELFAQFKVTEVGQDFAICNCKEGLFKDYGNIFCECVGAGEFKFNKINGRFLHTYSFGYFNVKEPKEENENTPSISIGKCSKF